MTTVRLNNDIDIKLSLLKDIEKNTKTEIIKKLLLSIIYDMYRINHHMRQEKHYLEGLEVMMICHNPIKLN